MSPEEVAKAIRIQELVAGTRHDATIKEALMIASSGKRVTWLAKPVSRKQNLIEQAIIAVILIAMFLVLMFLFVRAVPILQPEQTAKVTHQSWTPGLPPCKTIWVQCDESKLP